jgi:hypothetical protein
MTESISASGRTRSFDDAGFVSGSPESGNQWAIIYGTRLGVAARQHPGPIIEDDHLSGVSLDAPFEECAHERQVVMAVKDFSAAVPFAVACDELDAVLAFDRLTRHLGILPPTANRSWP